MNDFERHILGDIPFGESAAFFLRLKKMGAATDPPDETGQLEGQFPVPVEQVLQAMAKVVHDEFATMYAYQVYAQSLRDLSHDAVAEHFEEHASDELTHAQFLLKRMAVLGGPVTVPDITAPPPSAEPIDIIKRMIRMEQEGVADWKMLLPMVGDNPMKITIEDYAAKEQEHLDDLWQLLPHEARPTPGLPAVQPAAPGAPAEGPPAELAAPPYPPAKEGYKAAAVRMAKRASDQEDKGRQRAEANLAAKAKMHEGTRGELYGDLIGRLVGAGAGGAAGHYIHGQPGGALPVVAGAALGQMLAGRAGKAIGKEVDHAKHASVAKRAFEEAMNYLAHEQAAESAQSQNEAAYYQDKAKQEAQARQQVEQQLQAAAQQSAQTQAQLQQVQAAQQQAQEAATRAMMQAVTSNQEAIKHQQLASDTTMNLQTLRATLRQLSDEGQPVSGLDQGTMAAAVAGPTGPAGQAPDQSSGPTAMGPAGEGQAPSRPESPASGAQGEPTGQAVMEGQQRTKQGSVAEELASRAPYALGGAGLGALMGGLTAAKGSAGHKERVQQLETEKAQGAGGFMHALQLAKAKIQGAVGEFAEEHPGGAVAIGAGMGAMSGARQGPMIAELLRRMG